MWGTFYSIKAALCFRDYRPRPVTFISARRWIGQLDKKDRRIAGNLLNSIVYFSEANTQRVIVALNNKLRKRLEDDGIPAKKTVYVSFDETASSSHAMLGILRDRAALQQRGCNLCDSRDVRGLNEITNKLQNGAIVYIDDFIGSGRQFCASRDFAMDCVYGNFSEFMLVPSICEEGRAELEKRKIEIFANHTHLKADRPLHPAGNLIPPSTRDRLVEICQKIDPRMALGVGEMAAMVVFYRNSPNQLPAILRGNKNLKPFCGLFPRTKDLPFT